MLKTAFILCAAAAALAAQQTKKTCSLLTKAEIQQAIGVAVADGIPNKDMDSCRFQAPDGVGMVVLTASRDTSADSAKKVAAAKQLNKNSKFRDLANLGDCAILIETAYVGPQVSIFRGADNLLISVMAFGDTPKVSAAAEALARKAFSRF
jgi:hypothetical protein